MKNLRASAGASGTRNLYDNSLDFSSFGGSPSASGATNIAAINSFNTAYAALSGRTRLYIAPGTYNLSAGMNFADTPGVAGSKLTIEAYGVTITAPAGQSNSVAAVTGIIQGSDSAKETRIDTVSSGASTVTLKTAAQTSRFSVNQWCCVSGINMQGAGDPPNLGIFEFKKIQSIGTGMLTFTEPLVNSYKDTWPVYTAGRGGPATVFPMQGFWDQEVEFKGARFTDTGNLTYGKPRVMLWTDCMFDTYGPCPSVNMLFRSTRCTGAGVGGLEIDKCVHRLEFIDSMHRAVDFQSASINELYVSNMTQSPNPRWRGGARNSNTFINLNTGEFDFGVMNYGCMGPTTMTNCSATTGTFFNQTSPFSDYTEEGGGVLSYAGGPGSPNSASGSGAHWWATPGSNAVLLDGSNNFARSFQVSDVSQSGGRTYVTTNLPDPVPSTINGRSAPWKIIAHPCPSVTMTNCTGNTLFTTHSGLPAGTPFNSWTL